MGVRRVAPTQRPAAATGLCDHADPHRERSDETLSVPVLERSVRVRVDPVYGSRQFLGKNWQWLIATAAGLAGVVTAWIKLFGGE